MDYVGDTAPLTPPPPEAVTADESRPAVRFGRLRRRLRRVWRVTRPVLALIAAVIAAIIVLLAVIDIGQIKFRGQDIRSFIETRGSKFLERPLRLGRVTAQLALGEFVLEDLRIDGRTSGARPFFSAKRIAIYVPWWNLFAKQLTVEVRISGWQMVVEKFADNTNNVPHLSLNRGSAKPSWFQTRVNFVYAGGGTFTYDDHATPWSVVARNLDVNIAHPFGQGSYIGTARFTRGTVQIQKSLPMTTDFFTRFTVEGSIVKLRDIDLVSDGSVSKIRGQVDFANWPSQTYEVDSKLDFPRMREIFFQDARWRVTGAGRYVGTFQVVKGGRYELKGDFTSPETMVSGVRFPNVKGSLIWEPGRFAVTHAESDLYGGRLALAYGLEGIGTPRGSTATFNASYSDVDLATYARSSEWWQSIQPTGRAAGRVSMTWPNGHFSTLLEGRGETTVTPVGGATLAPSRLPAAPAPLAPEPQPFDPNRPPGPVPVGGYLSYRFSGDTIAIDDSWAASPTTYIGFRGRTDFQGRDPNIPIHVVSLNWQDSDRILAGVLNAFGSRTSAIEVGGRGVFDGVLTQSLSHPLVSGAFDGRDMRAWGVAWGRAAGDIVVRSDSSYLDIKNGVIGDPPGRTIRADGRFSLGSRKDGLDEINARVSAAAWPLADFKTAFGWTDWPIDGIGSTDLTLRGPYRRMLGGGSLRIEQCIAWGEKFPTATARLSFEPDGVAVNQIEMSKGEAGRVRASATLYWDKTYSFVADGARIPVETLDEFQYPAAPLTGVLNFRATGAADLDHPTYTFSGNIEKLFVADEEIGDVTGRFVYRDRELTIDQLEGTSSRLQVSLAGIGRLSLNELNDVDITLAYRDTSIDPYLKFVAPAMSEYTRLRVTGSVRLFGALADVSALTVDARIDDAKLTLFDYDLHNPAGVPLRLTLENNVVNVGRFTLAGEGTDLELTGALSLGSAATSLTAKGTVNLAILQAFRSLRDLRGQGTATLEARLEGDFTHPLFSGEAQIQDGTIRLIALPHSIEHLNGPITFDAAGISVDGLRGQMGEGDVTFGGSISLRQYKPEAFTLTAEGKSMHVRFPEGFQSTVDARLALTGPVGAPTLSGAVDVITTEYMREVETTVTIATLAAASGLASGAVPAPAPAAATPTGYPMKYDIQVNMPTPVPFISRKDARIVGHGDFAIGGTLDKPTVTGRIDLDGGEIFFGGNRYQITPTSSIEFSNPGKFVPFFDVGLITRARGTGQTYDVDLRMTGTFDRMNLSFTSQPWLSESDVITLLMGERQSTNAAETRALRSPQQQQEVLLRTVLSQILASSISSRVGGVFERALQLDRVQITPFLGSEATLQNPDARLTVVRRISSRAFVTYSRALNNPSAYEVILLEYDQNDRVSWILSRNEDRSFALDIRLRHVY